MLRMDVFAGHSLKESHDKTPAAAVASMHIESYDTHKVPYNQQRCKYLCANFLHLNLQSYKIVPIT